MSKSTTNDPTISDELLTEIANRRISDLVEQVPGTMSVLSLYGLDLCCGGGHQLGEALELHGIEAKPVLRQVAIVVSESQNG